MVGGGKGEEGEGKVGAHELYSGGIFQRRAVADVLLKKGMWLGGRWHSVKRYESVEPIRVRKGWAWVTERLDVMTGTEGTALRKGNGSVEGIFKAVAEIGKEVKEMRMLSGDGSQKEVKTHWSEFLVEKREEDAITAQMVYVGDVDKKGKGKGGRDRVTFTSKVNEGNDGREWFSNKPVGPFFFPAGSSHCNCYTWGEEPRGWGDRGRGVGGVANRSAVPRLEKTRSEKGWVGRCVRANRLNATKSPIVY